MIKGLPKVLVVDDEQDILELIRHSLSKEGFEVHVAANGAQAIEQAKKVKPEIIIMDVMMPIMDGMEACRQLKEIPETKNIPVIFLTARSEEFAELAGFEAGADDYIAKPVNLGELQAALERWGAADPAKGDTAFSTKPRPVHAGDLLTPDGAIDAAGLAHLVEDAGARPVALARRLFW